MKMRSLLVVFSILAPSVIPAFEEASLEKQVKRLDVTLRKAQERISRDVPVDEDDFLFQGATYF